MTEGSETGDGISLAAQRLVISILTSPTMELVLGSGIVTVMAHLFWRAIDHDVLFTPVIVGVALYDALVAGYMVKTMWRRVLE